MFLPDNIDLGKPEKYILSMRIEPCGFSFLIHDPSDKNIFCFQKTGFSNEIDLLSNIQRIVFDFNFLTEAFKQTNVIFVSSNYELIPDDFYDKQNMQKFYNFTHCKDTTYALTSENQIDGSKLVFELDEDLCLFLKRSLCNPYFYHHNGLLINYFKKKACLFNGNSMFVHFHEGFADLNCFDVNKNIFYTHTYYKEHYQDLVFYILSIWEKLNFDQLADHLFISGYYPDYQMEVILKDYIKTINNNGLFDQITAFGEKVQDIPLDLLILFQNENY